MSKQIDLRVQRTRKLLWESLVQLVETRDFDSVTVADITANAMVNRATFYRHYEDKYDLLERGTADVVKNLAEKIRPAQSTDDQNDFTAARQGLRLTLDHVTEHAGFYRIMLNSAAGSSLRKGIQEVIDTFLGKKIESLGVPNGEKLVPDLIVARVVSSVIVGLISWWIDENEPLSKDELVDYYLKMMVLGPYRCIGLKSEKGQFPDAN